MVKIPKIPRLEGETIEAYETRVANIFADDPGMIQQAEEAATELKFRMHRVLKHMHNDSLEDDTGISQICLAYLLTVVQTFKQNNVPREGAEEMLNYALRATYDKGEDE